MRRRPRRPWNRGVLPAALLGGSGDDAPTGGAGAEQLGGVASSGIPPQD
jgi:hypothetical protein